MCQSLVEHEGTDAKQGVATVVDFGGLKRRENSSLTKGIDPNRLEPGQVARQSSHSTAHPLDLGGVGQSQAFQHRYQFGWRLFGHRSSSVKVAIAPSTPRYGIRTDPCRAVNADCFAGSAQRRYLLCQNGIISAA